MKVFPPSEYVVPGTWYLVFGYDVRHGWPLSPYSSSRLFNTSVSNTEYQILRTGFHYHHTVVQPAGLYGPLIRMGTTVSPQCIRIVVESRNTVGK